MKFERRPNFEQSTKYLMMVSVINVFLLGVFLIVLLPRVLTSTGMTILLPRSITSEPVSEKGLVISILKDHTIYLGSQRMSLAELKHFFLSQKTDGHQVLIKADQDVPVGVLVRVWDLLRQTGAPRVNIATNE